MIAVGMSNDGLLHRPPGIDIEIPCLAEETPIRELY